MSKKALRSQLLHKQQEIERLNHSLATASRNAAEAKGEAQAAIRNDGLAAALESRQNRARVKAEESVTSLKQMLEKAQREAEDLQSRLKA